MNWIYTEGDPSIVLWTTAVHEFGLTLPDDAVVAELGCAETDWLERMRAQNPKMRKRTAEHEVGVLLGSFVTVS